MSEYPPKPERFEPAELTFEQADNKLLLKFYGINEEQSHVYSKAIEDFLSKRDGWFNKKEGLEEVTPGWHVYEVIGEMSQQEMPDIINQIHEIARQEFLVPKKKNHEITA